MRTVTGQIEILPAEDNLADATLLQECLREVPFPSHVSLVTNGEDALSFLAWHAPYTEAPTPGLLLLDIHLVKKSGWEVLEWVRACPALATVPVVMLTGALFPVDEQERDRLRPTRCLAKPTTVEDRDVVKVFAELISQSPSQRRVEEHRLSEPLAHDGLEGGSGAVRGQGCLYVRGGLEFKIA